MRVSLKRVAAICFLVFVSIGARPLHGQMDPFFTAVSTPVSKGSLMLMLLPDAQVAHTGPDFLTYMGMAEYGVTDRWTAGIMVEGQKIGGLPATFGGLRYNTYIQVFPHDRLLHFTVYGEYEDVNQAALYKMEISDFGSSSTLARCSATRSRPIGPFAWNPRSDFLPLATLLFCGRASLIPSTIYSIASERGRADCRA